MAPRPRAGLPETAPGLMAAPNAVPPDAAVNRAAWAAVNAEYTAAHAAQAWTAGEFGWGIFDIPERELGVLGDVVGLDVLELGCGTAYLSAWLARQGARPVGLDVTHAQLLTAHRCQQESGIWFPLIEADAGRVLVRRRDVRPGGVGMWREPVLRTGSVDRRGRAAAAPGNRGLSRFGL